MLTLIFEKVISLSLMASIMILIVFALKGLLRIKQGYIKKLAFVIMWMMVFLRLSIPFTLDSELFQINNVNPTQYVYQTVIQKEIMANAKATKQSSLVSEDTLNVIPTLENEKSSYLSSHVVTQDTKLKDYNIIDIAAYIWIFITMSFLILITFIYFTTLLRVNKLSTLEYEELKEIKQLMKIKRKIKIKISREDLETAVYGILKPTIVISYKNIDQIYHIVIHELVHIKSFDNLKKLFVEIVLSIHWFNPLVWISRHYLQKDIELACDEKVIALMGYEERKAYAQSILEFTSAHQKIGVKSFASFGENPVKGRIRNILLLKKHSIMRPVVYAAVAIFLLAGCMTNPIQQLTDQMVAYALEPNFVNLKAIEGEKESITDYYAVNNTVYYILSTNGNNKGEVVGYKIGKYNIQTRKNLILLNEQNSSFTASGLNVIKGTLFYCEKQLNDESQTSIIKYDMANKTKMVMFDPYNNERIKKNIRINVKGLDFEDIQLNGSDDYLSWHEIYRNTLGQCQDQLIIWDIKNNMIKDEIESNGNQNYANILDGYVAYQKYDSNTQNTLIVRREIGTGAEISVKNILSSQPYSAYANEQYFVYKEDFKSGAEIVIHKISENKDYFLWDVLSTQLDEKTLQEYRNGLWGINLLKDKLILTGATNIILEVDLENFHISIMKENDSLQTGFYQTKVNNDGATSLQQSKDEKGEPWNRLFYGKLEKVSSK